MEALNVQLTGQAAEPEPEPEPESESEPAVAADTITDTTAMTTAAAETETPPPPPTSQPSGATTDPSHVPMPADQPAAEAAAAEEEEEDDAGPGAIAVLGEEIVADITDKVTSMVAVHAFKGDQVQGQLTMAAGEIVELLNTHIAEGWSWVRSSSGAEGYVPEGYLESAPKGPTLQEVSPPAPASTAADGSASACREYRIDMTATAFGQCKCGGTKQSHPPEAFNRGLQPRAAQA